MEKSNSELFKQAINEGLSNKFDNIVQECTEEITYSDKHKLTMRTIIYGKTNNKRTLSPKMRRIIAILVAAALLLTSCGIIFRNEIREFFREFYVRLNYSDNDSEVKEIEAVYKLTYLPEGYYIKEERVTPVSVYYHFTNKNDNNIWFDQSVLNGTVFFVDIENGYTKIQNIQNYEVYYRYTDKNHFYVWNDGKHAIRIKSSIKISTEEMILIINGIVIK